MFKTILRTTLAAGLLSGLGLWAQSPDQQSTPSPDNTKMNQRDRSAAEPTADQQKENTSDRELARQIRRALVQDKSLSTYAHNVKIVAQNGAVTLKGPVKSEVEKSAIEQKAAEVAGGSDKIHSELEVKGETQR
ncbi:MAG TPA: BON domain-containing protein [Terriglobales bacterium]|nr:BON domain-containing protein [Terriglobales bacterium]